jgi:chromosome segregation ATPase
MFEAATTTTTPPELAERLIIERDEARRERDELRLALEAQAGPVGEMSVAGLLQRAACAEIAAAERDRSIGELLEALQRVTATRDQLARELDTATSDHRELGNRLSEAERTRQRWLAAATEQQERASKVEAEFAEAIAHFEAETDEMRKQIYAKNAQLDEARAKVLAGQERVKHLEARLDETRDQLEDELAAARMQLNAKTDRLHRAGADVLAEQERAADLEYRLDAVSAQAEGLKAERDEALTECGILTRKVERLTNERASAVEGVAYQLGERMREARRAEAAEVSRLNWARKATAARHKAANLRQKLEIERCKHRHLQRVAGNLQRRYEAARDHVMVGIGVSEALRLEAEARSEQPPHRAHETAGPHRRGDFAEMIQRLDDVTGGAS